MESNHLPPPRLIMATGLQPATGNKIQISTHSAMLLDIRHGNKWNVCIKALFMDEPTCLAARECFNTLPFFYPHKDKPSGRPPVYSMFIVRCQDLVSCIFTLRVLSGIKPTFPLFKLVKQNSIAFKLLPN